MVYREYPFLRIHWEPDVPCVGMEWLGFVRGPPFRDALNAGLALLQERGAQGWLADLRDLGVVDQEDQSWANEDWFPRAVEAGIRRMALIMPTRTIAAMSVESIMQEAPNGLLTRYFDAPAEARAWLRGATGGHTAPPPV